MVDKVIKKINIESNETLANIYNIQSADYENVLVSTLPFSKRVLNCCRRSKISTVEELLEMSPVGLMKIKQFGVTCLVEIDGFCQNIKGNIDSSYNVEKVHLSAGLQKLPDIFRIHSKEIVNGDFSVFGNYELSDSEHLILTNYIEAYETIDNKLLDICVNSPEQITPIFDLFTNMRSYAEKYTKIKELLDEIPFVRRGNRASGYIKAFTLDDDERKKLLNMFFCEESTIQSLLSSNKWSESDSFELLMRFLNWCKFDLKFEINSYFDKLYPNDKTQTVIQMRAKKQTLAKVGEILGVTRERVRQIELKTKKKSSILQSNLRIIQKIFSEYNGSITISSMEIREYAGERTQELIYLLQANENAGYTYDNQLDVFIAGEDSIHDIINNSLESLPDIIRNNQLEDTIKNISEESGIEIGMIKRAFLESFHNTGDVYHRNRLTLATVYRNVIDDYFPDGYKAHNPEEISKFRDIIAKEYGDIGIPKNDRALAARVTSACILCGRGLYKTKQKEYLPKKLVDKIYDYINENENTVFLVNTIFDVFKEELKSVGVNNRYYLQGILRELFGDEFFFRRDYISKDYSVTSIYPEVIEYIKKSKFPVSKGQLQIAFQGITDVIINFSVSDPDILNFYSEYLHASNLNILEYEKQYLYKIIRKVVSDGESHHIKEIYESVMSEKPEIFKRNAALYSFCAYSIIEYLFRDEFQFSRPYIAKNGMEIDSTGNKLRGIIYSRDEITIDEISGFAKENYFQIQSMLEYINGYNDKFVLKNNNTLIRIDSAGVNEDIAEQIENIIANIITETIPIVDLGIWDKLPKINIPWTEWLVYSVINKWGKKTIVATSSNQFRMSIPLIAPANNYDPSAFNNIKAGEQATVTMADDLSDIDALIEDILEEDFWLEDPREDV